jgi:hypothetical protein
MSLLSTRNYLFIGLTAMLLSNCAISQTSPTNEKITFSVPKHSERKLNAKDISPKSSKSHGYVKYANLNKGLLYDVDKVKFYVEAADSENKKKLSTRYQGVYVRR